MSRFYKQTGDIVELTDAGRAEIQSGANMYTESTRPTTVAERDWGTWNFSALWIGMLISIPLYMVASGLIVSGMSWKGALVTIVLGHTLVMFPAIIIGHAGTKYGLNYPMVSRFVFGTRGAIVASLARGMLGCFWFGVQCWIGGEALHAIFVNLFPTFANLGFTGEMITFLIFWGINLYVTLAGAKGVKILENIAAPILLFLAFAIIAWAYKVCGGFSQMLTAEALSGTSSKGFLLLFFPALSAMIAFDGAIALSMPDFTRQAKSQKSQIWGQLFAAPTMTFFIVFVGIAGTAGSVAAFGEAIWDPAKLVAQFENPFIVISFSFFIIMAVLTTNVAANLVPPSMVLSTLFSKVFTYKKAVVFAAVLSLFARPWQVLSSADTLIFTVLSILGAFLGPIAGLYMASYWVVHKRNVNLVDIYREGSGEYYYKKGWNVEVMAIFIIVSLLIFAGKFVPPLRIFFDNAYVFGLVAAGLIYIVYDKLLNKREA